MKSACRSWVLLAVLMSFHSAPAFAVAAHRNVSYDRPGASKTITIASYGDSIVAGYCGLSCKQDSYAQYYGYLNSASASSALNASIMNWIRGVSGNKVAQVLADMQKNTADLEAADIVTLEACGRDYLAARRTYQGSGANHCNGNVLDQAVDDCKAGISQLLDHMVNHAKPGALLRVMNIYYPGFAHDEQLNCKGMKDSDRFLQLVIEGNWYTCDYAWRKGITCIDAFADFNVSDANRAKVAWVPGESYSSYNFRLSVLHRDLISDAGQKHTLDGQVVNLLGSDDIHPNQAGHSRLGLLHHRAGYLH